jgi:hypothetical protein
MPAKAAQIIPDSFIASNDNATPLTNQHAMHM